ncbi:ribonuclease H-like domain-containing protein [Tanacetum coccineum]
MAKQSREPFPLSDHISTFLGDLVHLDLWGPYKVTSSEGLHSYVLNGKSPYEMIYKKPPTLYHLRVFGCFCFATIVNNNDKDVKFFESIFPFKDYVNEKAGTALIFFQNLNHINFFDVEYPKIPNDDKRVDPSLNRDQRSQSDSSHSFVFGGDVKTADFLNDNSGNDAQSSDDIFAAQDNSPLVPNYLMESERYLLNYLGSGSLFDTAYPRIGYDVLGVSWSRDMLDIFQIIIFIPYFQYSVLVLSVYGVLILFPLWSLTDAMNYKMDALLRNDTWEVTNMPKERKDIGSKWVFTIKYKSNGEIDRYKAKLVANGFNQKEDVNNAFLYGDLVETVYMKPLEGYFPIGTDKVCRLKKSLYGLKQAPMQWNAKLTSALIENGFSQSKSDYFLYTKSDKGAFVALLVCVDDIIFTSNSVSKIEKFKAFLKTKFMIKDLGKLKYFLGIEPAKTPLQSKLSTTNEATIDDPLIDNITDYQKPKCVVTKRSVTGYCVYLNNTLVSWKSKKQNTLSKSSTEAKYTALASVTSEEDSSESIKTSEPDLTMIIFLFPVNRHKVLDSCDELDGFVSIPDEIDMAFLWKKVKSVVAVGKRVLLQIIASLHREFSMIDLGSLNYFLGISVTWDCFRMFLSLRKYDVKILEREHIVNCNPSRTPVDVSHPTLYRSLAGSLQYLTFTRPDNSYAVQQICLYMHDPSEPHFSALKRMFRYIRGTLDYRSRVRSSLLVRPKVLFYPWKNRNQPLYLRQG